MLLKPPLPTHSKESNKIIGQVNVTEEEDFLSGFTFEHAAPIVSKLLIGSNSESDSDTFDKADAHSASWNFQKQRNKKTKNSKNKRKYTDSPTNAQPSNFKKTDKKATPKHTL